METNLVVAVTARNEDDDNYKKTEEEAAALTPCLSCCGSCSLSCSCGCSCCCCSVENRKLSSPQQQHDQEHQEDQEQVFSKYPQQQQKQQTEDEEQEDLLLVATRAANSFELQREAWSCKNQYPSMNRLEAPSSASSSYLSLRDKDDNDNEIENDSFPPLTVSCLLKSNNNNNMDRDSILSPKRTGSASSSGDCSSSNSSHSHTWTPLGAPRRQRQQQQVLSSTCGRDGNRSCSDCEEQPLHARLDNNMDHSHSIYNTDLDSRRRIEEAKHNHGDQDEEDQDEDCTEFGKTPVRHNMRRKTKSTAARGMRIVYPAASTDRNGLDSVLLPALYDTSSQPQHHHSLPIQPCRLSYLTEYTHDDNDDVHASELNESEVTNDPHNAAPPCRLVYKLSHGSNHDAADAGSRDANRIAVSASSTSTTSSCSTGAEPQSPQQQGQDQNPHPSVVVVHTPRASPCVSWSFFSSPPRGISAPLLPTVTPPSAADDYNKLHPLARLEDCPNQPQAQEDAPEEYQEEVTQEECQDEADDDTARSSLTFVTLEEEQQELDAYDDEDYNDNEDYQEDEEQALNGFYSAATSLCSGTTAGARNKLHDNYNALLWQQALDNKIRRSELSSLLRSNATYDPLASTAIPARRERSYSDDLCQRRKSNDRAALEYNNQEQEREEEEELELEILRELHYTKSNGSGTTRRRVPRLQHEDSFSSLPTGQAAAKRRRAHPQQQRLPTKQRQGVPTSHRHERHASSNSLRGFYSKPLVVPPSSSSSCASLRNRRPIVNHHVETADVASNSGNGAMSQQRNFLKSFRPFRSYRHYLDRQHSTLSTRTHKTPAKRKKQRWLIPAEHPLKIMWDILTILLSFVNAYATHTAIRDRSFGNSALIRFTEIWFLIDILLNFVTEHKSATGYILKNCQAVWARYLTGWFVVDVLSLFPGELIYVKPIIEQQNKRGFFKKSFFRTKAVIRVTRILRSYHVRWFGQVSKHTGMGASRLARMLIKYIPKYLLFFRNMRTIVVVRILRQVHWCRKVWIAFWIRRREERRIRQRRQPQQQQPPQRFRVVRSAARNIRGTLAWRRMMAWRRLAAAAAAARHRRYMLSRGYIVDGAADDEYYDNDFDDYRNTHKHGRANDDNGNGDDDLWFPQKKYPRDGDDDETNSLTEGYDDDDQDDQEDEDDDDDDLMYEHSEGTTRRIVHVVHDKGNDHGHRSNWEYEEDEVVVEDDDDGNDDDDDDSSFDGRHPRGSDEEDDDDVGPY